RWFQKYGMMMIFVARVLPIVRTFISFPAGIARMNIWKFSVYTFFGSLIWSFVLAYGGVIMGENWKNLEGYVRRFDWAILALFVFGIVWWVWRHVKNIKHE
ncbi:MAG: VTT domain-containing protein, partial [Candidatus Spechtbacteria bacterium]|nr:VTT domain-containing protein [Candidatus Spechtbacteria bacterium]